jgi:hypothetical protein
MVRELAVVLEVFGFPQRLNPSQTISPVTYLEVGWRPPPSRFESATGENAIRRPTIRA